MQRRHSVVGRAREDERRVGGADVGFRRASRFGGGQARTRQLAPLCLPGCLARIERDERGTTADAVARVRRGPAVIGAITRLAISAVARARTTPPASNDDARSLTVDSAQRHGDGRASGSAA